jgi:transposase
MIRASKINQKRHSKSRSANELLKENSELKIRVARLEARNEALQKEADSWRNKYLRAEEARVRETKKLELRVSELEKTLEDVKALLAWHQKHAFGQRTEQTEVIPKVEAPETASLVPTAKPRGKKPGGKGHGRTEQEGLFTEENEIGVPVEKRTCSCCGKPYRQLPKRDKSSVLELLQEMYKIIDLGSTYVKDCACDVSASNPALVRSPAPPRVFPRALYGPALWADILVDKFLFQRPLHRISMKYHLLGASVAVSTMSGGMKKIHGLIDGLFFKIKDHAKGATQWNMDETTWRVFGESERKASNKWWLWVVVTPDCCVYLLDPSRSASLPTDFFQGVSDGTLITDRYSAYKALETSIRKAFCWAHVRRDFINARDGYPKLRAWATEWIDLIDKLFAANAERRKRIIPEELTAEQIFARKYLVSFLVEEIEKRMDKELRTVKHERQTRILNSLRRHWQGLTIFVDDPFIPMDNNAAERALRNPVTGRKSYYGSGSEDSGIFSAKMFTIFQTWLFNDLDPISLMKDFLTQCANNRGQPPPDDDFLPWTMSEERKQFFRHKPRNVKH